MSKLESLLPNSTVKGILLDSLVTVINVQWFGSTAMELTFKTTTGEVANELPYPHGEPHVGVIASAGPKLYFGFSGLSILAKMDGSQGDPHWETIYFLGTLKYLTACLRQITSLLNPCRGQASEVQQ